MRLFVQGIIAGGILTAAALVGYAYGEAGEPEAAAGSCRAQVGYGSYTPGTKCYANQVMVGLQNGYLLCADLAVTCN